MTTSTLTRAARGSRRTRGWLFATGFGTEVGRNIVSYAAGWKAVAIQLVLFPSFALLFALFMGRGQLRDDLLVLAVIGFMPYQFVHEQINRVFWSYLGDIQAGVLEQTYLTPLPSWVRLAGRQVVAVLAALPQTAAVYLAGVVAITIRHGQLQVQPQLLLPLASMAVGSAGYALALSGATLVAKRLELVPAVLLTLFMVGGGAFVPLSSMPAAVATVSRLLVPVAPATDVMRGLFLDHHSLATSLQAGWGPGWLAGQPLLLLVIGAAVFTWMGRVARRRGTLGRY